MSAGDDAHPAVRRPLPRPAAGTRLICLHAAGSGASMYRPWPARFPEAVEVLLVQLPGRENRIAEPPIHAYGAAVTAVLEAIEPYLDRPFALLGHSMGARLAFGAAESLVAGRGPAPVRLFASGCAAPHVPARVAADQEITDEYLIGELGRLGGTDPAALREPELVSLILPAMRADFRVCASATPGSSVPLPVPITVFGAADDDVPVDDLTAWSRWSDRPVETLLFLGGHFFLAGRARPAVLDAVRARLPG